MTNRALLKLPEIASTSPFNINNKTTEFLAFPTLLKLLSYHPTANPLQLSNLASGMKRKVWIQVFGSVEALARPYMIGSTLEQTTG